MREKDLAYSCVRGPLRVHLIADACMHAHVFGGVSVSGLMCIADVCTRAQASVRVHAWLSNAVALIHCKRSCVHACAFARVFVRMS